MDRLTSLGNQSSTAQAEPTRPFSLQKILNISHRGPVFKSEGEHVVAGEAILSGATIVSCSEVEQTGTTLEALVREHSRLVYRIAYAVLRSHHDAEDATQETFMRVLRYRSKLPQVENPKTWLARIAWRVAVDKGRERTRGREVPLDDAEKTLVEFASADTPADKMVQNSEVEAVLEKLIAALPPKLREPLVLSAIEEMSPREVAATLGINEAAVRSRVFRARLILKEKLSQRMGKGTSL